MISVQKLLKSFSLGTVLGLLCFAVFYYLFSHSILDYDVSDGYGHGPDYGGLEWRSAFFSGIWKQSVFFGVLFGVASAGIVDYAFLRKKPNQTLEPTAPSGCGSA
jgi:ABC-type antimicrobial peptide transport system permease subunit